MSQYYPFPVYPLPYPYVSLMPCNDADTLYAHHQYYVRAVRQLNRLVVRYGLMDNSLEELIGQELNLPPTPAREIQDLAGLVYNHRLYFDGMSAEAAPPPENALTEEIAATYGSMDQFKDILKASADSVFGSGWVWLILEGGGLHLATTVNNETVSLNAVTPIFVLDVWEHAYFPIHRFQKSVYLDDWFSRVNWERAERNFLNGSRMLQ